MKGLIVVETGDDNGRVDVAGYCHLDGHHIHRFMCLCSRTKQSNMLIDDESLRGTRINTICSIPLCRQQPSHPLHSRPSDQNTNSYSSITDKAFLLHRFKKKPTTSNRFDWFRTFYVWFNWKIKWKRGLKKLKE